MCNIRLVSFGESCLQFEYPAILVDQHIGQRQPVYDMDSPAAVPDSDSGSDPALGSNDGMPRAKFLCSFGGSILPRPQDGKLRYVGGETRIVCFPREIAYEDFSGKMRELYEHVVVIKYQQPDEDLDALVSVVNDDDVMNMMEEYDKLGSGEGLSRLRIFLFSQMDQDFTAHYMDVDDRDSERRYVDALNNMNDPSEFWRFQPNESSIMRGLDEFHSAEQLYNPMTYDGSVHNQRNGDMPLHPYGLRHVAVPCVGSGQILQHGNQRLSEIDAPWSSGYYSQRQHGFHDPRSEFPLSPVSARFGVPFGEVPDNRPEQAPEENVRSQLNHQLIPENSSQTQDNGLWPHGDKSGPPGNASNSTNFSEVNSGCEHCQIPMPINQSIFEQIHMSGSLHGLNNPCMDCQITPDNHILNANTRMHPGIYHTGQPDPHGHSDEWVLQHRLSPQVDYLRANLPGTGRLPDHYLTDGSSSNYPFGHANLVDGHPASFNRGSHHHRPDLGSDIFHEHPFAPRGHVPFPDDRYVRYRNIAYGFGPDSPHLVSHLHGPAQSMWRNTQNPVLGSPPYEASNTPKLMNGAVSQGVPGHTPEGSPRFGNGSCEPSNNCLAIERNSSPGLMLDPNTHCSENDMITSGQVGEKVLPSSGENIDQKISHSEGTSCLGNPAESVVRISSVNQDPYLPQNTEIASIPVDAVSDISNGVRRVTLEGGVEVFNAEAANQKLADQNEVTEVAADGPEMVVIEGERELDSDNESNMKIEPTKAEEEAIARGLQTIKNEDLEEIRILGSGTYGAVYHGKWKGSDVAIKRIKASCFAGRPSERERLISDFWREASILSSLHHPNVVSFYGIVRDGPDGSLATVTEFMVNGSLKQFLQKKDRTIDRRKRLILAMDSAFGMEYLHGKNIVHFDLKCENLLVNMRDPQRPVCKIGDLGLSKVKQHTLVSGGVRGTLPWMAPELLSGKSNMVTEKIDVYSFGIVMWELLTGDEPYADMHCASIIGGIVNNTLRPPIPSWCDPEWRSLMESCWAADHPERPSFSEISQKLRTTYLIWSIVYVKTRNILAYNLIHAQESMCEAWMRTGKWGTTIVHLMRSDSESWLFYFEMGSSSKLPSRKLVYKLNGRYF